MQRDAAFIEDRSSQPRKTLGRAGHLALHGAILFGLAVLSLILWLPLRFMRFLVVIGALAGVADAVFSWHYHNSALGVAAGAGYILLTFLAAGAMLKLRNWIELAKLRWS